MIFSRNNPRHLKLLGKDLKIFGDNKDSYFNGISWRNKTNSFLLDIVRDHLKKDAIVFDIGANIGVTTLIFTAKAQDGQVYSFEPSPRAYPLLTKNIQTNNLNNCSAYQLACGANEGKINFLDDPNSASASHLSLPEQSLGTSNIYVSVITIDDFVTKNAIDRLDFIKIDVEGFEYEVLAGAKQTLDKYRASVFLEYNCFTTIAYGNRNPRDVLDFLTKRFPYIYYSVRGRLHEINDADSLLKFVHDNLVERSAIDDLYCTHTRLMS